MDFLVIDDDKTFRDATCLLIDGEGHYAQGVCSGELGLTELKEGKYDSVLLDLNLGPEKGLDILGRVKKETGLRTAFHHHCAGYVETPAEIEKLMSLTDPNLLGLVFDCGHYRFGGGDPVEEREDVRARDEHERRPAQASHAREHRGGGRGGPHGAGIVDRATLDGYRSRRGARAGDRRVTDFAPEVDMAEGAALVRSGTVVVVNGDTMGRGDDGLGAKLLRNFLWTAATVDPKPDAIVFYNAAVKLLGAGYLCTGLVHACRWRMAQPLDRSWSSRSDCSMAETTQPRRQSR